MILKITSLYDELEKPHGYILGEYSENPNRVLGSGRRCGDTEPL